ncbi:MAG: hypothetical protein OXQ29_22075 [Rhodospirillaceae bacterium]|nr:hypothetical protein [Rhodospirillaceae bacterium]
MKKLIAVSVIFPVITGCSALFPGKTFQTADFVCTKGETRLEIAAEDLQGMFGWLPRPSSTDPSQNFPQRPAAEASTPAQEMQRLQLEIELVKAQTEQTRASQQLLQGLMQSCDDLLS